MAPSKACLPLASSGGVVRARASAPPPHGAGNRSRCGQTSVKRHLLRLCNKVPAFWTGFFDSQH
eukprot:13358327-Alexandrium_andersonii.AAC.1